jgi:hypothetical protein
MTTVEQEIIDKFRSLDREAQKRVRAAINEEGLVIRADPENFDYEAWFERGEALREKIRARHGGVFPSIDGIGMLREIRDGEDEE